MLEMEARSLVSNSLYAKKNRMALSALTKSFLQPSPYAAMLFAPFHCTPHLPYPTLPAEAEAISKGHCRK